MAKLLIRNLEEVQMAQSIETKLRQFISEILTPFNDRFTSLTKDFKSLSATCDNNAAQLKILNGKLDREQKVRDQVGDLHVKMLTLVSKRSTS